MRRVFLNVDVGERGVGCADDVALIGYADVVNIACGGHAGDGESVAFFRGVAEGRALVTAHLSYPDRVGFGRRSLGLSFSELRVCLEEQFALLPGVRAVKCHGALYHDCCGDGALAEAMAGWFVSVGVEVVLTLGGGALERCCRCRGIEVLLEGFAERRYCLSSGGGLSLVARGEEGACIVEVGEALEQVGLLLEAGAVDTVCVHSDSLIALELAREVALLLGGEG